VTLNRTHASFQPGCHVDVKVSSHNYHLRDAVMGPIFAAGEPDRGDIVLPGAKDTLWKTVRQTRIGRGEMASTLPEKRLIYRHVAI